MNKIFTLLFFIVGCQAGELSWDESAAETEQEFETSCPPPNAMHTFDTIASITASGSDPSCVPEYYWVEPHTWSLDLSGPPPTRPDGKCSCKWTNPGYCINSITGEGPSISACNHGACLYYRSFECGYQKPGMPSTDCSAKATYQMFPVAAYGAAWTFASMKLVVTEPGCKRILQINGFNAVP